jgi:hypothetical protein
MTEDGFGVLGGTLQAFGPHREMERPKTPLQPDARPGSAGR